MAMMNNVARIYVVKAGDTLLSVAKKVYGDGSYSSAIANTNGINNDAVLPIGSRLAIPSLSNGLGDDGMIETLTVTPNTPNTVYYGPGPTTMTPYDPTAPTSTSSSLPAFLKDWRTYAVAGLVIGGLWLLFKKK